jgi:hypothetical protein
MSTVKTLADSLRMWRTEYLAKVGVPTVWPESWDFVAAVTACKCCYGLIGTSRLTT